MEAARKIYQPAVNPRTGEQLSPRFEPGSELGWRAIAGGPAPFSAANDYFKYVVFRNPNWDWRTFDLDRDATLADRIDNGTINATSTDLKKFVGAPGKADSLSRLDRHQHHSRGNHRVFRKSKCADGRRGRDGSISPPVYGSWNEPLRRRRGPERLQHAERAEPMGGRWKAARPNSGISSHRRKDRPYAAALCLSEEGSL